ncbi:hypothetical protein ACE939_11035 [Aquimarina sp. W85]|uniref:hypothetical protein n=1 Tax=Aquimarina rhodophyticola TaxID=3342246 RepID=UPI00366B847B
MLKGKKALYILLPLVAIIWGAIIYQIIDTFSDPELASQHSKKFSKQASITLKERDTFSIKKLARDPFLGTVYKKKIPVKKKNNHPVQPTINWPSIQYKGLIAGENFLNSIFLIAVNGQELLMKIKEPQSGVEIIKGTTTHVVLKYKGKRKQFPIDE